MEAFSLPLSSCVFLELGPLKFGGLLHYIRYPNSVIVMFSLVR